MVNARFYDIRSSESKLTDTEIDDMIKVIKTHKVTYCGNNLNKILHLVCNGVYYEGKSRFKRGLLNENSNYVDSSNNYNEDDDSDESDDIIHQPGTNMLSRKPGAYKECCLKACTILQLRAFCGKPKMSIENF
ncbi:unnamed protein product [Gordionus sp. m RMFG-2023]